MTTPSEAFFFSNGAIAACVNGEQVPTLQKSAVELWCELAVREGYDPAEFTLNLAVGRAQPFRTESGWNWRFV